MCRTVPLSLCMPFGYGQLIRYVRVLGDRCVVVRPTPPMRPVNSCLVSGRTLVACLCNGC